MDCIAIIPARFASTRFPGKLLAPVAGRPLIEHVVRLACRVPGIDAVVVATDDERIAEAARSANVGVVLSSDEFASGTDRVAAAAARHPADVIVNIQGDELLLDADAVGAAIERFRAASLELGTLRAPLTEWQDLWDPNVVKVVIDSSERALYFSRAPVPFRRAEWQAAVGEGGTAGERWRAAVDGWMSGGQVAAERRMSGGQAAAEGRASEEQPRLAGGDPSWPAAWVHIGVYLYRPDALRRWAAMPPSRLERIEGLEQLRVLEAGERMQTYRINTTVPAVNTPGDVERAEAALAELAPRA